MKIIVVGAGASGLMAAYELVHNGAEVVLLESLDRIGGRIQTVSLPNFTNAVEAGAEFIHGNLPLTLKLMKQAKLPFTPTSGKFFQKINRQLRSSFGESKPWETFYNAIEKLQKDCTVQELLDREFHTKKYENLRKEVASRAQGLDLADISRLSVFGIRDEWANEETQFRPDLGYHALLQWIYNQTVSENFALHLNQTVQKIEWSNKKATVLTQNQTFASDAVLLTLPPIFYNSLSFYPEIPQTTALFDTIGFGEVIKIALEFEIPFWENDYPDLGFLFADEGFTFWTQLPNRSPMLIGWLGNDYAPTFGKLSDGGILNSALKNLNDAFDSKFPIKKIYKSGAVFRYTRESQFHGGYSWPTPQSRKAISILKKGVQNTIWFAGEALHTGKGTATVEAALQSGRKTALQILKSFKK